jgi:aspartyl-tRNA(Asn)/glutamyl-tRNA(Gln) amidotransferase subunit A
VNPLGTSAAAIAAAVAERRLSATEVVEAHLDAIAAAEHLNAFTLVDGERALARAADLDDRIARGEDVGPLAGVPVGLKDLIDHAGRPTTAGSSFLKDVAAASATVVERIEAAGGVIVGRTGLHEFAFGFSSENAWWGPVRNPWDPTTSPGGSSGGSAAAVAARLTPLAVGTDPGGSVRVPAAVCGIVGLKVTHGRVPLTGVFPLAASLDTVGPLAHSVTDTALLYRVMAGDDPADRWTTPQPVVLPEGPADLGGLRVAMPRPWIDTAMDRDTRTGYVGTMDRLVSLGVVVESVEVPEMMPSEYMNLSTRPEIREVHREWYEADPSRYGSPVRERMVPVLATDLERYPEALAWRAEFRNVVDHLLDDFDVIATPTVAARPKVIGEPEITTEAGPVPYRAALSWFTALVNNGGHPAISLPVDSPGSPPPALQLIGSRWGEDRLLAIGLALEEAGIVVHRTPPHAAGDSESA